MKRRMRKITMDILQAAGTRERNPEAATTFSINTATGEKVSRIEVSRRAGSLSSTVSPKESRCCIDVP